MKHSTLPERLLPFPDYIVSASHVTIADCKGPARLGRHSRYDNILRPLQPRNSQKAQSRTHQRFPTPNKQDHIRSRPTTPLPERSDQRRPPHGRQRLRSPRSLQPYRSNNLWLLHPPTWHGSVNDDPRPAYQPHHLSRARNLQSGAVDGCE